jgi:hypothetical protein
VDEARQREDDMAKGQLRSTREKKKPKADRNKKKKSGPAVSPLTAFGNHAKWVPNFLSKKTS